MTTDLVPAAFRSRVTIGAGGCWMWNGKRRADGYGVLMRDTRHVRAHRLFYETLVGDIATGSILHHTCHTPYCVNPAHLEQVTRQEHLRLRRIVAEPPLARENRRKTHCPQGHPYDDANTYRPDPNKRICRACNNAATKRYRERKAAA